MKVVQISDELYDKLKNCVVDPFDDTPESAIGRLTDIADKAKTKWSPLEAHVEDAVKVFKMGGVDGMVYDVGSALALGRRDDVDNWTMQANRAHILRKKFLEE